MKPRPKVPTEKAPIAIDLRQDGEAVPAAEGFSLLHRQLLPAALLAHCATGAQAKVEVIEDLGPLLGHRSPSV